MTHDVRKADHIRINLEEDVQFPHVSTGLEKYRLIHQALPELDLASIDTSTHLIGSRMGLPLLISSMTGGTQRALGINRNLALAAQTRSIAMGMGSQRAGLEQPETVDTFQVREIAQGIVLFANLGAAQLNRGYGVEQCRQAVDMIGADGLILHLNPLQEALQADGDRDWSGLLKKIAQVCRRLQVPVVAKEVGWGISEGTAKRLAEAGVAAIDVAGAGGTSWSEVERHRAPTPELARLAQAFADWGIPTAESILAVRRGAPSMPIIASGGIRTGIEAAKAIALGATAVGIASPFLKAATVSSKEVLARIDEFAAELRIAMFCSGAGTIAALRDGSRIQAAS